MLVDDLSSYMLIAILAMAICMAITPIMIRLAPVIGMVDLPDQRKVHGSAIPRSGGIGIIIGLIIPLVIFTDLDQTTVALIVGALSLLLFGAWDDSKNIRPALKFLGQFLAAICFVYYGDIYVHSFPFLGVEALPEAIGKPFTVIAIVGMINALNLSDGLDGLAGGEALISLMAISYMAYQYDGDAALSITVATIGGIFGFLRFNSHPARIFMGDAGSQTLGFILGAMVVYLSQQVNAVISPVTALLLLGLPVMDSLVVFTLRAKRGDSLVVAAKDHLHHRLLGVGFHHYESVTIIYFAQIILVSIAVLLPYESDLLLMGLYIAFGVVLYSLVTIAEMRDLKVHRPSEQARQLSDMLLNYPLVAAAPYKIVKTGLSIILLSSALMATTVPVDIGISALLLASLILIIWFYGQHGYVVLRLVMFISLGTSSYLISTYPPAWLLDQMHLVYIFYGIMMISAFTSVRLTDDDQFAITPLDYLVIIIAMAVAMAPDTDVGTNSLVWIAIQMIILFYSAEILIQRMESIRTPLTGTLLVSLILVMSRSLL